MTLTAYEAAGLFLLWLIQFVRPSLRHEMLWVYSAWIAVEFARMALGKQKMRAFSAFARVWKARKN
jgi:hypothetical protein